MRSKAVPLQVAKNYSPRTLAWIPNSMPTYFRQHSSTIIPLILITIEQGYSSDIVVWLAWICDFILECSSIKCIAGLYPFLRMFKLPNAWTYSSSMSPYLGPLYEKIFLPRLVLVEHLVTCILVFERSIIVACFWRMILHMYLDPMPFTSLYTSVQVRFAWAVPSHPIPLSQCMSSVEYQFPTLSTALKALNTLTTLKTLLLFQWHSNIYTQLGTSDFIQGHMQCRST